MGSNPIPRIIIFLTIASTSSNPKPAPTTARTSHPLLKLSASSSLCATIMRGLSDIVNPSASTISLSMKYFSQISSIPISPSIFLINANFTDEYIATASAPAFAYFHESLPSISISKSPCLWYFKAPTRRFRFFSSFINASINLVFPLLLFPTMQITGIIEASQDA
ncbi:MAG: hypothetical protein PHU34_02380 [Candidatus Methanoperedens sp.]|nr:hypothetical protein [Candidatus Methanoperedens sp.]